MRVMKKDKIRVRIVTALTLAVALGCVAVGFKGEEEQRGMPVYGKTEEELAEFNSAMFEDSLPMKKSLELLNKELGESDTVYQDYFVGAYVEKISKRAEKLNASYRMFKKEIEYYTGGNVKKVNSKLETDDLMIQAIMAELESPYFLVIGDKIEESAIGVNYGYIAEVYGDKVTPDFNSRLELMDFSNNFNYNDPKDGHPNFKSLYSRYQKINEMLGREGNEENLYLVSEAYKTYYSLLGIRNWGMNIEDKYNEEALDSMRKFITANASTDVGKDVQKVLEAVKKEGVYGEETEKLAERLLEDRFSDYIDLLKNE